MSNLTTLPDTQLLDNVRIECADNSPMAEAVRLAQNGRWATAPNPMVGAVLAREGEIVARGWHTAHGKPHAEVECLRDAQEKNVDPSACTLWVTLEPCNHTGKTPPCTRAILKAGVQRVVIGAMDPNPDVSGGGAEFLRENGVTVETGVQERACKDLIADFLTWKYKKKPYTMLKLASTLDGKIATRTGHSQWVSGETARKEVHELRAHVGAVIVGGNTFYEDNPQLTHRLQGLENARQPVAVVITSRLPDSRADFHLLRERAEQTVFWTPESIAQHDAAKALRDVGCRVWGMDDLVDGFEKLYQENNCLYALCEGGGSLGLSLLEADIADELLLYMAPKLLGDTEARNLFSGRTIGLDGIVETMDQSLALRVLSSRMSGKDVLLSLRSGGA